MFLYNYHWFLSNAKCFRIFIAKLPCSFSLKRHIALSRWTFRAYATFSSKKRCRAAFMEITSPGARIPSAIAHKRSSCSLYNRSRLTWRNLKNFWGCDLPPVNSASLNWRYVLRRITAASLSQKVWINGRMNTASQWTSRAPGSRQITRLLNHLTAVCGMKAWTFTGFCHWKMSRKNPTTGAGNTIMRERIHH